MAKRLVNDIIRMKHDGQKIVELTAYDFTFARMMDETDSVDIFLVGDSLGMVVQGHPTPIPVTVEQMIYHVEMVSRATKNALVIADMPFMSYQINESKALENAGRMIQEGGANAVKLEGAGRNVQTIRTLVEIGIPVQGHVGLTPQSYNKLGWKVQGKTRKAVEQLKNDALKLQDAGVFSVVLEAVPVEAARIVTEALDIPTIGIGAGKHCDGQVLVMHDMLGMGDYARVFVKEYAQIKPIVQDAIRKYSTEVRSGEFPGDKYAYKSGIDE